MPLERIIVTINQSHLTYAQPDIASIEKRNIIIQPFNRETSASILLPLLHILRRDPDARVIIFPSDHYVSDEPRFMAHVTAADKFVQRHPKFLLLLGIHMEEHEADYGWIETNMKIADVDGCEIFRVKRFLEKPDAKKADTLQKNRTLCNTMVLAGLGSTVLRKFRLTTPTVFHAFKQIDGELFSPREAEIVRDVFATLPSVDFSKAILGHDPRGLAVLHVKGVYWNDWGDAARIQADIARLQGTSAG